MSANSAPLCGSHKKSILSSAWADNPIQCVASIPHRPEAPDYKLSWILRLNPGSCGRLSFDQEITLAVMDAEDSQIQVEEVAVPHERVS